MSRLPNKPGHQAPLKVAVVGAHGTGKTTLVLALHAKLSAAADSPEFQVVEALPLATAVADDLLHPQNTAVAAVAAQHQHYDLTLLLGLDLPMPVASPSDRIAAAQRLAFDARLRQTLNVHGLPYTVVYGTGAARTDCALQAIGHHIHSFDAASRRQTRGAEPTWQWCCDTCSDAACEHQLFSALLKKPSMGT